MSAARRFEGPLATFCRALRGRVRRALVASRDAARPAGRSEGDVQYRIDRLAEDGIVALAARAFADLRPFRLLTEGTPPEGIVVAGRAGGAPRWRVIVDPIDGTRGLMYGKRSAFVLAGIAPEKDDARLDDLVAAAMVEIPPLGAGAGSDVLVATRGAGVRARRDGARASSAAARVRPSAATRLGDGFATFNRFLDGAQDALGALAEDFFARALTPAERGRVFEDQYVCNAGQMHGLLTGKDRLVVDVRPLFRDRRGGRLSAAHPYDVLGALLLEEAGCPVTDARGATLAPPLDVATDVAWIGWANAALRRRYEPHLLAALRAAARR